MPYAIRVPHDGETIFVTHQDENLERRVTTYDDLRSALDAASIWKNADGKVVARVVRHDGPSRKRYAVRVPFLGDALYVTDGEDPRIIVHENHDDAARAAAIWRDKDGRVVGEVVEYEAREAARRSPERRKRHDHP